MSTPSPQYEFRPEESPIFRDLARKMRAVGGLTLILGAIASVFGVVQMVQRGASVGLAVLVATGLFLSSIGYWSMRSAREFQLVSDTHGHDISHLMTALRNLHRLYSVQYIAAMLFLALLAFLVVFGFLAEPAH